MQDRIKLIMSVTVPADFCGDFPEVATATVTREDINRMFVLAEFVRKNGLYRVEQFDYRCEFFEPDYESDEEPLKESNTRIDYGALSITGNNIYWSGYFKHTDIRWETSSVSLKAIAESEGDLDVRDDHG